MKTYSLIKLRRLDLNKHFSTYFSNFHSDAFSNDFPSKSRAEKYTIIDTLAHVNPFELTSNITMVFHFEVHREESNLNRCNVGISRSSISPRNLMPASLESFSVL